MMLWRRVIWTMKKPWRHFWYLGCFFLIGTKIQEFFSQLLGAPWFQYDPWPIHGTNGFFLPSIKINHFYGSANIQSSHGWYGWWLWPFLENQIRKINQPSKVWTGRLEPHLVLTSSKNGWVWRGRERLKPLITTCYRYLLVKWSSNYQYLNAVKYGRISLKEKLNIASTKWLGSHRVLQLLWRYYSISKAACGDHSPLPHSCWWY